MVKMVCMIVIMLFIAACNDSDIPQKAEHDSVWKQQADRINKAKDVEHLLNNAVTQQKQSINR